MLTDTQELSQQLWQHQHLAKGLQDMLSRHEQRIFRQNNSPGRQNHSPGRRVVSGDDRELAASRSMQQSFSSSTLPVSPAPPQQDTSVDRYASSWRWRDDNRSSAAGLPLEPRSLGPSAVRSSSVGRVGNYFSSVDYAMPVHSFSSGSMNGAVSRGGRSVSPPQRHRVPNTGIDWRTSPTPAPKLAPNPTVISTSRNSWEAKRLAHVIEPVTFRGASHRHGY